MSREEIEDFIDDYIDMGCFAKPDVARPYLLDGFSLAQAEIDRLRAENERIVSESEQCHSRNDELVSDHIALRAELEKAQEEKATALADQRRRMDKEFEDWWELEITFQRFVNKELSYYVWQASKASERQRCAEIARKNKRGAEFYSEDFEFWIDKTCADIAKAIEEDT